MMEVFVVDNNSEAGSLQFLMDRFPQVKFIMNATNEGFAKANNQAVELTTGELILFLNPDTIVPEDCFEKCISFFSTHPRAGALGIRMIDGAGNFLKESKRAFPSPSTSLFKLSGLARIFPKNPSFARYYLGHLSEYKSQEVDVLAGAFMMIPRNVIRQTGSFDEQFFMYGEDVDLSYRIQKAGFANYYFAESTIIHFKGESTRKGSLNYVRMFHKAMSLFVKKHYHGSRASIFNFLLQGAIWSRALFTVLGKFLRRIGLPMLDAVIILLSFRLIKFFWSTYVRESVNYSPNMLTIAFPIFTAIFLASSYFSGLYDNGYKSSQLNRSTVISTLVLLSGYALLPESVRFSRGILVFGIGTAYILMSIARWLLLKARLIKVSGDEILQTIIVANEADYNEVRAIMQKAGMQERVLGRVGEGSTASLGSIHQLGELLRKYPVKELVFCQDGISFKEIIRIIQEIPPDLRNKFHASGSTSIIGSDSKDESGEYVASNKRYALSMPLHLRNKRLADIGISFALLISFPIHFFTQKRPLQFFRNVLSVLNGKRTWVGYASSAEGLPKLKPGILTSTSLPHALNELPPESLYVSDEGYATDHSVSLDMRMIWKRYSFLYH